MTTLVINAVHLIFASYLFPSSLCFLTSIFNHFLPSYPISIFYNMHVGFLLYILLLFCSYYKFDVDVLPL